MYTFMRPLALGMLDAWMIKWGVREKTIKFGVFAIFILDDVY